MGAEALTLSPHSVTWDNSAMKNRLPAVLLVLVGLGLGATLLRDQVPVSGAQPPAAEETAPASEAGARLQNERNTMDIVRRYGAILPELDPSRS